MKREGEREREASGFAVKTNEEGTCLCCECVPLAEIDSLPFDGVKGDSVLYSSSSPPSLSPSKGIISRQWIIYPAACTI